MVPPLSTAVLRRVAEGAVPNMPCSAFSSMCTAPDPLVDIPPRPRMTLG